MANLRPSDLLRRAALAAAISVAAAAAAACAPSFASPDAIDSRGVGAPQSAAGLTVVPEAWISAPIPAEPDSEHDIDSLAVWQTAPGEAIVLVTAKQGDQIWVLDANTGELIRRVGGPGNGPGRFERPNGIAVVGDLAIVVERDNARLQVLRLPDFEHLGFAGEAELTRPYGIAAFAGEQGIEVYVTDNYETPDEQIPPAEELGRRVRHFRLHDRGDALDAELINTFGDTSGEGILHKVETIAVDASRNRLLVVDELESELAIRVYTLDGTYVETMGAGIFAHEPEGIALFETAGDSGYWIATDQQAELSLFLVFDRGSLAYLGGFTGEVTANTDGVTLTQLTLAGFPAGAFYAVNDDATVTAFDWRDIAQALGF